MNLCQTRIAIIGLGYVGLPLAVEFGKHYPTIGFDLKAARVAELRAGHDSTRETTGDDLHAATHLTYTTDPAELAACNVYIITVPTPIDRYRRPDLSPLESASRTIGKLLKPGDVVIYESTVYPGCTEEICVPILEHESGLAYATEPPSNVGAEPSRRRTKALGFDNAPTITTGAVAYSSPGGPGSYNFFVGYSPERINPGDHEHRLTTIKKVTSGSTSAAAQFIDDLYRTIISAGTHLAPSIRVAEAAKVIENTQRDVNIALINELAMLFHRLDLDTAAVLAAAGSKWNFLPFRPGLVGGHCIGVDPYYLTHKAQEIGFHTEMILAGRRINDHMGVYVVDQVAKLMARHHIGIRGSRILILGITFKENCPDIRNTRVIDIFRELEHYGAQVEIHDPWADPRQTQTEYDIDLVQQPEPGRYDALILAVGHDQFKALGSQALRRYGRVGAVLYDVKNLMPSGEVDGRL
jgi:UDP-N-acetyl-D-glucosamine/UDP-N-acetyl-D-galactosamine dehydrogenase